MIFTKLFNSEYEIQKQKIVFNFALITAITDNNKCFIVEYLGNDCYIEKDVNSQNLFDYFAAKAAKDILGVQNLDTMQSKINDMLANLKLHKNE